MQNLCQVDGQNYGATIVLNGLMYNRDWREDKTTAIRRDLRHSLSPWCTQAQANIS